MVDEHGRSERQRHVPDVIERERKHLPTDHIEPVTPAAELEPDSPLEGFAPDAPDTGYWAGLDVGHRRALVAGIVGGLLLLAALGGSAWYLLGLREPAAPVRRAPSSTIPSETPTASAGATGSAETTDSSEATSAPGAAPVKPGIRRAPLIAYRAGGAIWLSGEHGGSPRSIYPSAAGAFALSPDGLKLAYVDPSVGTLRIIDITVGRSTEVGEAIALRPEWAPDSSFLVYTRPAAGGHSEEVAKVGADGKGARALVQGWRGRVMADGVTVAAAPVPMSGGSMGIAVLSDGRRVVGAGKANVTEVCPTADGLYFADAGGLSIGASSGRSAPSIGWIGYDGKGTRTVVAKPASSAGVAFSDLQLSPDGSWLVYAETGDDGYSRLFALPTSGGKAASLTPRLDGYFMGWSADGTELFMTEGNAVQGEATRVSAVRPDGTGRRIIVEGGGI